MTDEQNEHPTEAEQLKAWVLENYDSAPVVRAVMSYLAPIDAALSAWVQRTNRRNFETLLDEIANGNVTLDSEKARSDHFIHSFRVVSEAASREFRESRVRDMGRVLMNFWSTHDVSDDSVDDFEAVFNVLVSMSAREYSMLLLLREAHGHSTFNLDAAASNPRIILTAEEIQPTLMRLSSLGLVERMPASVIGDIRKDYSAWRITLWFDQITEYISQKTR